MKKQNSDKHCLREQYSFKGQNSTNMHQGQNVNILFSIKTDNFESFEDFTKLLLYHDCLIDFCYGILGVQNLKMYVQVCLHCHSTATYKFKPIQCTQEKNESQQNKQKQKRKQNKCLSSQKKKKKIDKTSNVNQNGHKTYPNISIQNYTKC